jgi:acetylornithine/succinyldiaminopimelate/putrescine aminotransferase
VRLLPPLIIGEAEVNEAVLRFEKACGAASQAISHAERTKA